MHPKKLKLCVLFSALLFLASAWVVFQSLFLPPKAEEAGKSTSEEVYDLQG